MALWVSAKVFRADLHSTGAGAAALCSTAFVAPTAQTKSLRATRAGEAPPPTSHHPSKPNTNIGALMHTYKNLFWGILIVEWVPKVLVACSCSETCRHATKYISNRKKSVQYNIPKRMQFKGHRYLAATADFYLNVRVPGRQSRGIPYRLKARHTICGCAGNMQKLTGRHLGDALTARSKDRQHSIRDAQGQLGTPQVSPVQVLAAGRRQA